MPRRYNLRKRQETVKWVEDDTLKDKDEDSEEDSDFASPEETEASEDISLDEEDDDDGDDAFEKETGSTTVSGKKNIMVPMPKRGMRVTIQIEGEGYKQPPAQLEEESEVDEEEFEDDLEEEDPDSAGDTGEPELVTGGVAWGSDALAACRAVLGTPDFAALAKSIEWLLKQV
jgi:hypothetical protein